MTAVALGKLPIPDRWQTITRALRLDCATGAVSVAGSCPIRSDCFRHSALSRYLLRDSSSIVVALNQSLPNSVSVGLDLSTADSGDYVLYVQAIQ